MRTFSRSDWNAAQEAWLDFSPEWREVRHQAAMRGVLFPPSGSRFDSWGDDSPSQRAMLIRAIRETPALLATAVSRSRSWSDVIANLLRSRDDWREEIAMQEAEAARRRLAERPVNRRPMVPVGNVLATVAESLLVIRAETPEP